ncbi:MAG: FAD-binding oxidoreductase [Desulfobacterales bacterium]|nr:FAD-binding oxidoreductase [Desulfobacterales bacterium]MDX2510811.1 FAD-binding oxidoreductase [Desulfobacterales bacterium]
MTDTIDIIIIGGGIMGSATAYSLLLADNRLKIVVIEKDPSYTHASTTLSMSNARIQFSLKQNVQISRYAFEILEQFEEDMAVGDKNPRIGFKREGNLFVGDEKGLESAKKAIQRQHDLGCDILWKTPEEITAQYPLYRMEGYVGGSFGPQDGYFDAYAALMGYKAKAIAMGARYIEDEAIKIHTTNKRVDGVALASGNTIGTGIVINCAGAWAAQIAGTANVALPVEPVKRQVFVLDTTVKPEQPLPLTVLPSDLYFRTETGGHILLGKSMDEDPVGFDFSWDEKRFYDVLWLELAEFVPAFDTLKLIRGWAGLYAVNRMDSNAILGEWPEIKGLFLANGFSGHGLQQAPAVGRYLSEIILGKDPVLDLSIFSPRRILENKPLTEMGLV